MRRVMHFDAAAVIPPVHDVLLRIGMPRGVQVTSPIRELLDDAEGRLRSQAEPRAVVSDISTAEFEAVYRGEGMNAESSPLELIVPRAEALALFVGTVGEGVSEDIHALFRADDPALGMILDAYASEAANRLAYLIASQFLGDRGEITRALPYSPGYCGWHVSGQRALFRALQPSDIGVSINGRCLMTPVKSVSGVLVAGEPAVHRFRPAYAFCDECSTSECIKRMASVR